MAEYLEKIDRVISDANVVKSFSFPYVGAVDDENVIFSPPQVQNEIVLTPKWNGKEIVVEGPCVMKFLVPSYSLITANTIYFKCDKTAQSPLLTYPNLTNPLTSNVYTISLAEVTYGYDGVITQLQGNQKITPYLEELFVEFYEPGICQFTIDPGLTDLVNNATIVVMDSESEIQTSDDVLLLMRNNLIKQSSCYFTWTGSSSARIYLSTDSFDFYPSDTAPFVSAYYDLEPDTPVQFIDNLKSFTQFWLQAKVVSDSPGVLTIKTTVPPSGGAVLLEYDKPISLQANDDRVFGFPKNWTSTQFVAPTAFGVEMYVSNQPDFVPVERGENVLEYYVYDTQDATKVLYLSSKEIANLRLKALDDYIYVRFRTAATTTITPMAWITDGCLENTIQFEPNVRKNIPANSSGNIYRLRYKDFEGYGLTIKWSGNSSLRVYLADICNFAASSTDPNLLLYTSIARRKSYEVSLETVESWGSKLDEDGYIYVRFNTTQSGNVTFVTEKPVPADPEISTNE